MHAGIVADDVIINQNRLLPYEGFASPVFRLEICGQTVIFMLDTGSTCNIAFETLTRKFPFTEVVPTDQTVEGLGGLTATVLGKLFISLTIGQQTLMEPFLLSDYPIANLDGIIGTGCLKRFHTWSLGGSPATGAHLEINGVAFQLRGFGTNHGDSIAISLLEPAEESTAPERVYCAIGDRLTVECTDPCNVRKDHYSNLTKHTHSIPNQISTSPYRLSEQPHSIPNQISTSPYLLSEHQEPIPVTDNQVMEFRTTLPRTTTHMLAEEEPREEEKRGDGEEEASLERSVSTQSNQGKLRKPLAHREGKGALPRYSALFIDSQWKPNLTPDEQDLLHSSPSRQRIYATQPGCMPPRGEARVVIQAEGALRHKQYLITPFFDQDIQGLVKIESRNPWAASLILVNHTDQPREWKHGSFLGFLEEVESVLTPTHTCTGDPTYGRETAKWYQEREEEELLLSLASINQQVNYYEAGEGALLAGPAPDHTQTCNIHTTGPHTDPKAVQPLIVTGDFRNRHQFGPNDVIACLTNASAVTSHGLSRVLENSYPHGSVYQRKSTKNSLLADDQLRTLGTCILKSEEDSTEPCIASLVGKFLHGAPIDQGGYQESYLAKLTHHSTPMLQRKLLDDTMANRAKWFSQALEELVRQIGSRKTQGNHNIQRVFFPARIGCVRLSDRPAAYEEALLEFTRKAAEIGTTVYLVVDPEEDPSSTRETHPPIQPARVSMLKHTAGGYRDIPSTFCKDPTCQGCPNNKGILNLLHERIAGEELGEGQPVTGITDGMSPDARVPSAKTAEERKQLFESLLEDVKIGNLESEQLEQVKALLRSCSQLFITSDDEPAGLIRGLEVDIPTTGPPISCKMRRFSPRALRIMEELNRTMLRKGLTRPCDGPWSSPVVLVKKKPVGGQEKDRDDASSYRFCIDYRSINAQRIAWKAYPTANMKSQLQRASGYVYYSTLDINAAFHCIKIREESQPVTAFALPSGLFCFTRLPFGLSISPQIWAKAADSILKPVRELCSYYADDIIGHSNTFEDHLSDMRRILEALMASGVKIQLAKCQFFVSDVIWLGHKISREGISPDPKGVENVQQLRPPRNRKEVQSVIGTLNYFKDFIDGYSDILLPLSKLLKKREAFEWGEEQDRALQTLKDVLTSAKVLVKPDFDRDFFLQCDASDFAVSAILSQKDESDRLRPIQYWSKKMSPSELNYSASEKEALAVYLGFKKFESYLLLNTTHVLTDAAALTAFYGTREVTSKRVLRWALFVGQFHHTVTHVRGMDNDLADLCSRCVNNPEAPARSLVTMAKPRDHPPVIRSSDIQKFQALEEPWKNILNTLARTTDLDTGRRLREAEESYVLNEQGLLCIKDKDRFGEYLRVIVPSKLVPLVLYWNHDAPTANHQGFDRTLRRIRLHYYWPFMIQDSERYVRSCALCQLNKESIPYLKSNLRPCKMQPDLPGEILCMDIAHLPRSTEGFLAALVIVDLFSRLTVALPMRDMTANTITKAITEYCCRHGFPTIIFTDQAGAFRKALQDTCSHLLETRHHTSVPWRHCANISERYIRLVKDGLKLMLPPGKFGWWARYIKFVTYAINTSYCQSLKATPFEAYYARKPGTQPSLGDLKLPTQYVRRTEDWLQPLREGIKHTSIETKNKYLAEANAKNSRPDGAVQKGDLVVIKRHDFQPGFPDKLQTKREGPLKVTEVRGTSIDMTFMDTDRGTWTRHISELAPFFVRPDYLSPSLVNLDSHHIIPRVEGKRPAIPRTTPKNLYGKLVDHADEQHLIVVGLDALSKAPTSETIEELILDLNYYSPYMITRRHVQKQGWEAHFTKTPRALGSVTFAQSKTRRNNATICSLVTQVYQGPPVPLRDLDDFRELPNSHLQVLEMDTRENRCRWLEDACQQLAANLTEEIAHHPITGEVVLEGELFLEMDEGSQASQGYMDENRVRIIEEFTWRMGTLGITVSAVWRKRPDQGDDWEPVAKELPFTGESDGDEIGWGTDCKP